MSDREWPPDSAQSKVIRIAELEDRINELEESLKLTSDLAQCYGRIIEALQHHFGEESVGEVIRSIEPLHGMVISHVEPPCQN
jgi:hypothetical protein